MGRPRVWRFAARGVVALALTAMLGCSGEPAHFSPPEVVDSEPSPRPPPIERREASTSTNDLEAPAPTQLTLICVDESGAAVEPSTAELLFTAWGTNERHSLNTDGNRVYLRVDEPWIHSLWPLSRGWAHRSGRVLLKAQGHVTVCSEPIYWLGTPSRERGVVERTAVRFPGQDAVTLVAGDHVEQLVVFRRPGSRHLVVLDPQGLPVPGVRVRSEMFWSHENRCCFPVAIESLGSATTGDDGRIELVDGDFEYNFEPRKANWTILDHIGCDPDRIQVSPTSPQLVIRMREFERQRLELTVTEDGRPAVGRLLIGQLTPPRCGADYGPLGTTDKRGRILLPDFRPDAYGRLWFEDDQRNRVWSARPSGLTYPAHIEVKLHAPPAER